MRATMSVVATLGLIVLYLLAVSTGNASRLADYYWDIVALSGVLGMAMLGLIGRQLWQLRQRVRAKVFGAKLTLRMVLMFTLVAVLPGVLVFTVSMQFLNKSIESWFDVHVESGLERGLNLGRNALDYLQRDLEHKARQVATEANGLPPVSLTLKLPALREKLGVSEIAVFDLRGQLLGVAGTPSNGGQVPTAPPAAVFTQIEANQTYRAVETPSRQPMQLRVAVPAYPLAQQGHPVVVQLIQPVPPQIAEDAELVEATRAEYRQLAFSREGLKRFYRLTLGLTLLITLLGAIGLGLYLSDRLSAPLGALAAGTRAVAQGDFSRQHPIYSRDELGMLTAMFNRMTKQLADARAQADASHAELQANNAYLESILVNLSAGVLAFNADDRLTAANTSATRILGVDAATLQPYALTEWAQYAPQLASLVEVIARHRHDESGHDWQVELDFEGAQRHQVLLVRGTRLPEVGSRGYVVVFDDVTDLARAQRDAAWGEVAKRLAHEIRNPLTPIQLSAERLQMKLSSKLSGSDAEMLTRATDTIVKQVAALKGMVDAFRDYARAPTIHLAPLDVSSLIREVLALYESHSAVVATLPPQGPVILGDAALLRQVFHNLLANAQDAVCDAATPLIHITATAENNAAVIVVEDNGQGFAADILPRAFEPYITNKAKGTGLGLAVVKKIIEEHHGSIHLGHSAAGGARVRVVLPCAEQA